jgi:hypothetical protein
VSEKSIHEAEMVASHSSIVMVAAGHCNEKSRRGEALPRREFALENLCFQTEDVLSRKLSENS